VGAAQLNTAAGNWGGGVDTGALPLPPDEPLEDALVEDVPESVLDVELEVAVVLPDESSQP
jgi:hypothetical protein